MLDGLPVGVSFTKYSLFIWYPKFISGYPKLFHFKISLNEFSISAVVILDVLDSF